MDYIVISVVSLLVSVIALLSGFGLSTILMPVFALFFPVSLAIAAVAIVHLVNNVFQIVLVGRNANWRVVLYFALPAAFAALVGAWLLVWISSIPAIATYRISDRTYEITIVKLVIGLLIILFASFNLIPERQKLAFSRRYLPLGGILSGFFGGLSGNQGALRSAFLIKSGLDAQAYIGTNAVCGFIVDIVRLIVYGVTFYSNSDILINNDIIYLVLAAIGCAFVGSVIGSRLVKIVTLHAIQSIVSTMLILVGAGLAVGLI